MNVIPEVNVPIPCTRDLWRIRIHDTINIDSIFFVISELQEVVANLVIYLHKMMPSWELL